MRKLRSLLLGLAALSLQASGGPQAAPGAYGQAATVGRLMYRTAAGRAVTLQVVDGGHPAFVTLQREQGDAEVLRQFVLAHSGPEKVVDKGLVPQREKAPLAWKVDAKGDRTLLLGAEATYWRYTPGLVLPIRFKLLKQEWTLMTADLPHRMFVENP